MKTMRRVWRVGCKGGVQEKNLTREVRTPLKIPEHAPVINTHTKCSYIPEHYLSRSYSAAVNCVNYRVIFSMNEI